ncbi:hypothetical protein [Brachybacterium sacelli]
MTLHDGPVANRIRPMQRPVRPGCSLRGSLGAGDLPYTAAPDFSHPSRT